MKETMPFGLILKHARTSEGHTRNDAAKILDISPKTLEKYENAGVSKEGQFPSLLRLAKLVEHYDIDPRYLMSSLIIDEEARNKVLRGVHLKENKASHFMQEQISAINNAISDEIEKVERAIQENDAVAHWYKDKGDYQAYHITNRYVRGLEIRSKQLIMERQNMENSHLSMLRPDIQKIVEGSKISHLELIEELKLNEESPEGYQPDPGSQKDTNND